MSQKDSILYDKKEGIARIILNRPEVLNALNMEVLITIADILDEIKEDNAAQAVIITGAGEKAFSAGADIRYLSEASPLEVRELAHLAINVNSRIEELGKVVVAAMNGFALGGGLELAEACTLRIASSHAKMGHPEVRIGAVAGWGGTTRLPRLIGKGRAAELLLTGRQIAADEAYHYGLVNRVVEKNLLLSESEKLIREILSNAPLAVRFTWEALHRGLNMTLEESTHLGADCFGLVSSTQDFREGTGAFLKKKAPSFRGK